MPLGISGGLGALSQGRRLDVASFPRLFDKIEAEKIDPGIEELSIGVAILIECDAVDAESGHDAKAGRRDERRIGVDCPSSE